MANLPWDADEEAVRDLFSRYGHVQQATVIFDKRTGRSKGFAFVDMPSEAAEDGHRPTPWFDPGRA